MPETNQPSTQEQPAELPDLDPGPVISGAEFFLIGGLAATYDVASWFGVDIATLKLGGLTIGGILGLWAKYRTKEFPHKNFWLKAIIEMIPIVGDISPTWTLFVFRVYRDQKKRINQIEITKAEIKAQEEAPQENQ